MHFTFLTFYISCEKWGPISLWYFYSLNNSNTENVYCTQVYAKLIQFNFLENITAGCQKILSSHMTWHHFYHNYMIKILNNYTFCFNFECNIKKLDKLTYLNFLFPFHVDNHLLLFSNKYKCSSVPSGARSPLRWGNTFVLQVGYMKKELP